MTKKITKKARKKARKPRTGMPGHKYEAGNQFWKVRSTHGRLPIFKSPEQLLTACEEYFQWVDDNPVMGVELVKYQGEAEQVAVPKMRAMTISGLCIFLGINKSTWFEYAKKPDFSNVTEQVEEIIRTQKFQGAAADLLNPNIIARDLGLRDNISAEHSGPGGGPIETITAQMNPVKASEIYRRKLKNGL